MISSQRAVLVGTPSVVASDALSESLREQSIDHVVLNAVQHAHEAQVVAAAGQVARVTIATNMAGRGTDIVLDDSVCHAGGLHVIATEMHSSARIDRQLIGRAARQGDPGSYRFCLSLEDELFRHAPNLRAKLLTKAQQLGTGELPKSWLRHFRRVQSLAERLNRRNRKLLFDAERQQREQAARTGIDTYLESITDE